LEGGRAHDAARPVPTGAELEACEQWHSRMAVAALPGRPLFNPTVLEVSAQATTAWLTQLRVAHLPAGRAANVSSRSLRAAGAIAYASAGLAADASVVKTWHASLVVTAAARV
jgi:hypothetical protein